MAHIVLVAGKTDSGKTHHVRRRVHTARRLVVVDTTGEWDVGGVAAGKVECLKRLRSLARAQEELGRALDFRLACRVAAHEADSVLRAVWALQPDVLEGGDPRYHVTLVSEEAHLYDWTPKPPSGAHILATLGKRIARPWILLTTRLALIGPNARSNAGELVLFEQDEPADFDALAKRRGRDVAERVRALRGHQYVVV